MWRMNAMRFGLPRKMLLIMRISFLLLFAFMIQVSATSLAQKVVVKNNQLTYEQLFDLIESQTGLRTFSSSNEINLDDKISVKGNTYELEDLLKEVVGVAGLTYDLIDNYIVVRPLNAKEKAAIRKSQQQPEKKVIITGTVKDEKGEPLPFAAVCFKGTTTGCVSAVDGTYELEVPDEKGLVLEISSLGFITQEIPVEGRTTINIILVEDIMGLDEVVVTGYQTIEKGRATGSFVLVKEEDIQNIASVDLSQRLEGVASGVNFDLNGELQIRGTSTLKAGNKPLIVVDGFPFNGGIDEINPNDIDQISVLKDAASTAIYGIRGANGVIVINTKQGGSTDQLELSVNSMVRFSEKLKYEDLGYMSAAQQVDYSLSIFDNYGTAYPGGTQLGTIGEFYQQQQEGLISEAEANAIYDFYRRSNDIQKHLLIRPLSHKHDISFRHGTEKNRFYASIAIDDQKYFGSTATDEQNLSLVINDKMSFNKYLDFSVNVKGRYNKSDMGSVNMYGLTPYTRFYDEDGEYINDFNGPQSLALLELLEQQGAKSHFNNALQNDRLTDNTGERKQFNSSFKLDIKPIDGVVWSNSVNYDFIQSDQVIYYDQEAKYVRNLYNQYMDSQTGESFIPYGHLQKEISGQRISKTYRSQLNVDKSFNDFRLSVIGGFERNEFTFDQPGTITRYNYNKQALSESYIYADNAEFGNIYGNWVRYNANEHSPNRDDDFERFQSIYFTGSLSYKDRYNFFGSWRLDETNLFGQSAEYRQQPSWSAGFRWVLSEEQFMDSEWLDYLSFKTSYGLAGRVDPSTSPYLIVQSGYDFWPGYKSNSINNPENPLLGWEKSYSFNAGFDFRLFNLLGGSIEYYHTTTKDVLALTQLDPTNGFPTDEYTRYFTNNGEIINHGIDLSLNAAIIKKTVFSYDATLNFSYNYNEITDMDDSTTDLTQLEGEDSYVIGQPIDFVHAVNSHIDADGNYMITKKDGTVVPGSDFATFTSSDLDFYRRTPPVFGSFNNQFKYKNWNMGMFFTYEFGNKVRMYDAGQLNGVYTFKSVAQIEALSNAWTTDNTNTNIPKQEVISDPTAYEAHVNGSWNVTSANNIQLRSINLGYDFTSLINSDVVKGLTLNANVENLWNWSASDYDRLTPIGAFPLYKTYTFTLNARF
jgi:TonB-linked SusC/RagA family outer membrane protein